MTISPEHQKILDHYAPGQSGSAHDYELAAEQGRERCAAEGHLEPRWDSGDYLFCNRCGLREYPDGFTTYGLRRKVV